MFWRKVLDIYATSLDYNRDAPTTKAFFAKVQNKLHYAIHGQTAAELIQSRADSSKPQEVLIRADKMSYDSNTDEVSAEGNVEVSYGDRSGKYMGQRGVTLPRL